MFFFVRKRQLSRSQNPQLPCDSMEITGGECLSSELQMGVYGFGEWSPLQTHKSTSQSFKKKKPLSDQISTKLITFTF